MLVEENVSRLIPPKHPIETHLVTVQAMENVQVHFHDYETSLYLVLLWVLVHYPIILIHGTRFRVQCLGSVVLGSDTPI